MARTFHIEAQPESFPVLFAAECIETYSSSFIEKEMLPG
jgi:hypothetical protein